MVLGNFVNPNIFFIKGDKLLTNFRDKLERFLLARLPA